VAEAGTHNELLARRDGEYAKLVHRQMAGGAGLGSQPPSQLPSPTDLASLGSAPTAPPPEPPPPTSSKPSSKKPSPLPPRESPFQGTFGSRRWPPSRFTTNRVRGVGH
jgi:hypothetical protein